MNIAVTGLMYSGKTTLGEILKGCGYRVFEIDDVAWKLYENDNVKFEIVHFFGNDILEENNISRDKLKNKIGNDKDKLLKIAEITAPFIVEKIKEILNENDNVVIVAALLCFWRIEDLFDKVVFIERNIGSVSQEIKIRRDMQIEWNKNCRKDIIIDNDGNIDDLRKKVKNILC